MHIFTGVSASPGVVIGPVEQIDHGTTGLHRIVCDPFRERALYDVAVVLAKDELRRLSQRAKVRAVLPLSSGPSRSLPAACGTWTMSTSRSAAWMSAMSAAAWWIFWTAARAAACT